MHTLITARLPSVLATHEAQKALMDLPSQNLPDVADSVIVTADPDGAFRLEQGVNFWTTERDTLSLMQLVRWTLFVQPLLGIISGPGVNALRDAIDDFGIPADFAARLQSGLSTGQTALIVMPRSQNTQIVVETVQRLAVDIEQYKLEGLYEADLQNSFRDVLGLINIHQKSIGGTAA